MPILYIDRLYLNIEILVLWARSEKIGSAMILLPFELKTLNYYAGSSNS